MQLAIIRGSGNESPLEIKYLKVYQGPF